MRLLGLLLVYACGAWAACTLNPNLDAACLANEYSDEGTCTPCDGGQETCHCCTGQRPSGLTQYDDNWHYCDANNVVRSCIAYVQGVSTVLGGFTTAESICCSTEYPCYGTSTCGAALGTDANTCSSFTTGGNAADCSLGYSRNGICHACNSYTSSDSSSNVCCHGTTNLAAGHFCRASDRTKQPCSEYAWTCLDGNGCDECCVDGDGLTNQFCDADHVLQPCIDYDGSSCADDPGCAQQSVCCADNAGAQPGSYCDNLGVSQSCEVYTGVHATCKNNDCTEVLSCCVNSDDLPNNEYCESASHTRKACTEYTPGDCIEEDCGGHCCDGDTVLATGFFCNDNQVRNPCEDFVGTNALAGTTHDCCTTNVGLDDGFFCTVDTKIIQACSEFSGTNAMGGHPCCTDVSAVGDVSFCDTDNVVRDCIAFTTLNCLPGAVCTQCCTSHDTEGRFCDADQVSRACSDFSQNSACVGENAGTCALNVFCCYASDMPGMIDEYCEAETSIRRDCELMTATNCIEESDCGVASPECCLSQSTGDLNSGQYCDNNQVAQACSIVPARTSVIGCLGDDCDDRHGCCVNNADATPPFKCGVGKFEVVQECEADQDCVHEQSHGEYCLAEECAVCTGDDTDECCSNQAFLVDKWCDVNLRSRPCTTYTENSVCLGEDCSAVDARQQCCLAADQDDLATVALYCSAVTQTAESCSAFTEADYLGGGYVATEGTCCTENVQDTPPGLYCGTDYTLHACGDAQAYLGTFFNKVGACCGISTQLAWGYCKNDNTQGECEFGISDNLAGANNGKCCAELDELPLSTYCNATYNIVPCTAPGVATAVNQGTCCNAEGECTDARVCDTLSKVCEPRDCDSETPCPGDDEYCGDDDICESCLSIGASPPECCTGNELIQAWCDSNGKARSCATYTGTGCFGTDTQCETVDPDNSCCDETDVLVQGTFCSATHNYAVSCSEYTGPEDVRGGVYETTEVGRCCASQNTGAEDAFCSTDHVVTACDDFDALGVEFLGVYTETLGACCGVGTILTQHMCSADYKVAVCSVSEGACLEGAAACDCCTAQTSLAPGEYCSFHGVKRPCAAFANDEETPLSTGNCCANSCQNAQVCEDSLCQDSQCEQHSDCELISPGAYCNGDGVCRMCPVLADDDVTYYEGSGTACCPTDGVAYTPRRWCDYRHKLRTCATYTHATCVNDDAACANVQPALECCTATDQEGLGLQAGMYCSATSNYAIPCDALDPDDYAGGYDEGAGVCCNGDVTLEGHFCFEDTFHSCSEYTSENEAIDEDIGRCCLEAPYYQHGYCSIGNVMTAFSPEYDQADCAFGCNMCTEETVTDGFYCNQYNVERPCTLFSEMGTKINNGKCCPADSSEIAEGYFCDDQTRIVTACADYEAGMERDEYTGGAVGECCTTTHYPGKYCKASTHTYAACTPLYQNDCTGADCSRPQLYPGDAIGRCCDFHDNHQLDWVHCAADSTMQYCDSEATFANTYDFDGSPNSCCRSQDDAQPGYFCNTEKKVVSCASWDISQCVIPPGGEESTYCGDLTTCCDTQDGIPPGYFCNDDKRKLLCSQWAPDTCVAEASNGMTAECDLDAIGCCNTQAGIRAGFYCDEEKVVLSCSQWEPDACVREAANEESTTCGGSTTCCKQNSGESDWYSYGQHWCDNMYTIRPCGEYTDTLQTLHGCCAAHPGGDEPKFCTSEHTLELCSYIGDNEVSPIASLATTVCCSGQGDIVPGSHQFCDVDFQRASCEDYTGGTCAGRTTMGECESDVEIGGLCCLSQDTAALVAGESKNKFCDTLNRIMPCDSSNECLGGSCTAASALGLCCPTDCPLGSCNSATGACTTTTVSTTTVSTTTVSTTTVATTTVAMSAEEWRAIHCTNGALNYGDVGDSYTGPIAVTGAGQSCLSPAKCRNTGGTKDMPWCFTHNGDGEWGFCNVCGSQTWPIPVGVYLESRCVSGALSTDGGGYTGDLSTAADGTSCSEWHGGFASGNNPTGAPFGSRCRNVWGAPDHQDKPWCFVNGVAKLCDICASETTSSSTSTTTTSTTTECEPGSDELTAAELLVASRSVAIRGTSANSASGALLTMHDPASAYTFTVVCGEGCTVAYGAPVPISDQFLPARTRLEVRQTAVVLQSPSLVTQLNVISGTLELPDGAGGTTCEAVVWYGTCNAGSVFLCDDTMTFFTTENVAHDTTFLQNEVLGAELTAACTLVLARELTLEYYSFESDGSSTLDDTILWQDGAENAIDTTWLQLSVDGDATHAAIVTVGAFVIVTRTQNDQSITVYEDLAPTVAYDHAVFADNGDVYTVARGEDGTLVFDRFTAACDYVRTRMSLTGITSRFGPVTLAVALSRLLFVGTSEGTTIVPLLGDGDTVEIQGRENDILGGGSPVFTPAECPDATLHVTRRARIEEGDGELIGAALDGTLFFGATGTHWLEGRALTSPTGADLGEDAFFATDPTLPKVYGFGSADNRVLMQLGDAVLDTPGGDNVPVAEDAVWVAVESGFANTVAYELGADRMTIVTTRYVQESTDTFVLAEPVRMGPGGSAVAGLASRAGLYGCGGIIAVTATNTIRVLWNDCDGHLVADPDAPQQYAAHFGRGEDPINFFASNGAGVAASYGSNHLVLYSNDDDAAYTHAPGQGAPPVRGLALASWKTITDVVVLAGDVIRWYTPGSNNNGLLEVLMTIAAEHEYRSFFVGYPLSGVATVFIDDTTQVLSVQPMCPTSTTTSTTTTATDTEECVPPSNDPLTAAAFLAGATSVLTVAQTDSTWAGALLVARSHGVAYTFETTLTLGTYDISFAPTVDVAANPSPLQVSGQGDVVFVVHGASGGDLPLAEVVIGEELQFPFAEDDGTEPCVTGVAYDQCLSSRARLCDGVVRVYDGLDEPLSVVLTVSNALAMRFAASCSVLFVGLEDEVRTYNTESLQLLSSIDWTNDASPPYDTSGGMQLFVHGSSTVAVLTDTVVSIVEMVDGGAVTVFDGVIPVDSTYDHASFASNGDLYTVARSLDELTIDVFTASCGYSRARLTFTDLPVSRYGPASLSASVDGLLFVGTSLKTAVYSLIDDREVMVRGSFPSFAVPPGASVSECTSEEASLELYPGENMRLLGVTKSGMYVGDASSSSPSVFGLVVASVAGPYVVYSVGGPSVTRVRGESSATNSLLVKDESGNIQEAFLNQGLDSGIEALNIPGGSIWASYNWGDSRTVYALGSDLRSVDTACETLDTSDTILFEGAVRVVNGAPLIVTTALRSPFSCGGITAVTGTRTIEVFWSDCAGHLMPAYEAHLDYDSYVTDEDATIQMIVGSPAQAIATSDSTGHVVMHYVDDQGFTTTKTRNNPHAGSVRALAFIRWQTERDLVALVSDRLEVYVIQGDYMNTFAFKELASGVVDMFALAWYSPVIALNTATAFSLVNPECGLVLGDDWRGEHCTDGALNNGDVGDDYRGTLAESGANTCLQWSSFPDFTSQYPGDALLQNYCRNPGDDGRGPYCFTSVDEDENPVIGYCDVCAYEATTEPPTTASTTPSTTASTTPSTTTPSTTASTTPSTTTPSTTASTTAPTTASTTPSTTASTTAPTTASTTPSTTASSVCVTFGGDNRISFNGRTACINWLARFVDLRGWTYQGDCAVSCVASSGLLWKPTTHGVCPALMLDAVFMNPANQLLTRVDGWYVPAPNSAIQAEWRAAMRDIPCTVLHSTRTWKETTVQCTNMYADSMLRVAYKTRALCLSITGVSGCESVHGGFYPIYTSDDCVSTVSTRCYDRKQYVVGTITDALYELWSLGCRTCRGLSTTQNRVRFDVGNAAGSKANCRAYLTYFKRGFLCTLPLECVADEFPDTGYTIGGYSGTPRTFEPYPSGGFECRIIADLAEHGLFGYNGQSDPDKEAELRPVCIPGAVVTTDLDIVLYGPVTDEWCDALFGKFHCVDVGGQVIAKPTPHTCTLLSGTHVCNGQAVCTEEGVLMFNWDATDDDELCIATDFLHVLRPLLTRVNGAVSFNFDGVDPAGDDTTTTLSTTTTTTTTTLTLPVFNTTDPITPCDVYSIPIYPSIPAASIQNASTALVAYSAGAWLQVNNVSVTISKSGDSLLIEACTRYRGQNIDAPGAISITYPPSGASTVDFTTARLVQSGKTAAEIDRSDARKRRILIVGCALGGLAFVVLVCVGVCMYKRRKTRAGYTLLESSS